MRRLAVMLIAGMGFFLQALEARAVFTYVPEAEAPSAPIIQQNAQDVLSGRPLPQAAPLAIPQNSAPAAIPNQNIDPKVGIGAGNGTVTPAERAKAEALIQRARQAEREHMYSGSNTVEYTAGDPGARPMNTAPVSSPVRKRKTAKSVPAPAPVMQQPIQPVAAVSQMPIAPAYAANALSPGAPPLVIGKGSMREQLIKYSNALGYQVAWNCPNDLIVTNETMFATGSFAGNLRELFETLQRIGRRDMSATLFQGNRTIVVEPARR